MTTKLNLILEHLLSLPLSCKIFFFTNRQPIQNIISILQSVAIIICTSYYAWFLRVPFKRHKMIRYCAILLFIFHSNIYTILCCIYKLYASSNKSKDESYHHHYSALDMVCTCTIIIIFIQMYIRLDINYIMSFCRLYFCIYCLYIILYNKRYYRSMI